MANVEGVNMVTDFCNALWETQIECDTVSSDGFEVSNLISRDVHKKRQGFLAERFVKPVVSILVSFPFPVDVCAINVNPQVGGQKICGIEILAAGLKYCNVQNQQVKSGTSTNKCTIKSSIKSTQNLELGKGDRTKPNDETMSVFHSYEQVLNVNNIKQEFNKFFYQILRVRLVEGKVGHFSNARFQDAVNAHYASKILSASPGSVQSCNLQQGNRLQNTSHLWIRITQVHKGSIPCLGRLEIIGKPCENSNTFVMNYSRLITLRLKREREFPDNINKPNLSMTNSSELITEDNNPCEETSLVDNVPADFIDPITFNVMTLPILLPSGTTIDNSTLEKHIATEKNWGRQPSDPFTGVPLGSKVVPNTALKYRIDNFLLSADVKVDELGRTIGSTSGCISTAKLKFDTILAERRNKIKPTSKRKVCEMEAKQPPLKKRNTDHKHHLTSKPDSLDQALENVLSAGQKSTSSSSVKTSSLVPSSSLGQNECNEIAISSNRMSDQECPHQEQTSVLFQLPCQHVVCRPCLSYAAEKKQCLYCKTNFEKKDVVRVHSKRM